MKPSERYCYLEWVLRVALKNQALLNREKVTFKIPGFGVIDVDLTRKYEEKGEMKTLQQLGYLLGFRHQYGGKDSVFDRVSQELMLVEEWDMPFTAYQKSASFDYSYHVMNVAECAEPVPSDDISPFSELSLARDGDIYQTFKDDVLLTTTFARPYYRPFTMDYKSLCIYGPSTLYLKQEPLGVLQYATVASGGDVTQKQVVLFRTERNASVRIVHDETLYTSHQDSQQDFEQSHTEDTHSSTSVEDYGKYMYSEVIEEGITPSLFRRWGMLGCRLAFFNKEGKYCLHELHNVPQRFQIDGISVDQSVFTYYLRLAMLNDLVQRTYELASKVQPELNRIFNFYQKHGIIHQNIDVFGVDQYEMVITIPLHIVNGRYQIASPLSAPDGIIFWDYLKAFIDPFFQAFGLEGPLNNRFSTEVEHIQYVWGDTETAVVSEACYLISLMHVANFEPHSRIIPNTAWFLNTLTMLVRAANLNVNNTRYMPKNGELYSDVTGKIGFSIEETAVRPDDDYVCYQSALTRGTKDHPVTHFVATYQPTGFMYDPLKALGIESREYARPATYRLFKTTSTINTLVDPVKRTVNVPTETVEALRRISI